jgi:hypothetical protein
MGNETISPRQLLLSTRSKYRQLLEDKDVKRWFDNLAARSMITATVYLRTLGLYCELNKTNPKKILDGARSKEFRDSFLDFVRRMENEGKAGSYIVRFKKVIISWLSHNNIDVKLKVNIRGESDTPTIANERVPQREELARILRHASPRGRVSASLIGLSGLRPETLGDYAGSDGLRLKDLPETTISGASIEFTKSPTLLVVRKNLSKSRHQYFTFMGEEETTYVKEYLDKRARAGEKLTNETPLLGLDPRGAKKNNFLRTALVSRDVKEAMTRAGFTWRPYVLRAYFDTQLMIAENHGKVSHAYRQFWMGHKGDIEATYTTNKGRLPDEVVEDMRDTYRRCLGYLQTTRPEGTSEEMIKEAFKKQLLLVAGFKQEEIEGKDLAAMTDEEFQAMVRQRLLGAMMNNGAKQKVICVKDIEDTVAQGWEFVALLPDDRAIMRIPD